MVEGTNAEPVAETGVDEKADETTKTDGEKAAESQDEEAVVIPPPLTDMVVLPPRQKSGSDASGFTLSLPPIRPEEPVQSLRLALSEVVGLAHMTSYRIEVEPEESTEKPNASTNGETKDGLPLISPFTGTDAVVCIPAPLKSLDHIPTSSDETTDGPMSGVLDEFSDLQSTTGVQSGAFLRIVLERYDAASVKDHVFRTRHILDGNVPALSSLVEDVPQPANKQEEKQEEEPHQEEVKADSDNAADGKTEELKPLPGLPHLETARVDGKNLKDFFYLCAGEDPAAYAQSGGSASKENTSGANGKSKKKKGRASSTTSTDKEAAGIDALEPSLPPEVVRQKLFRINQLEAAVHVPCTIQYSGFHPPPPFRRMVGDIAYLEVSVEEKDGSVSVLHISSVTHGFYVNRTKRAGAKNLFDPSPAAEPCFAHTLLDCLLQASPSFAAMWKEALQAAKEKSELMGQISKGSFSTLFRLAIKGDAGGHADSVLAMKSAATVDSTLTTPSWLISLPKGSVDSSAEEEENKWNRNLYHGYHPARAEDELTHTFGVDVRSGALRDWNEELQLAREMPITTIVERLERARVIHKTMTEFGEAALVAVKAISEGGQIQPMNPNEGTRTQVYLHNNIFVSRALDVGPETFRLVKDDRAAKKSAGREIQCIKTFHRMEGSGFHTLATVLIDYLGSRFICQSILPGILQGEKSHTILLGSVDIEVPMKCDEEFQALLREKVGEALNLLDRSVYTSPLTEERREECKKMKKSSFLLTGVGAEPAAEIEIDPTETMVTCAPLETKGIRGSDQRMYLLDFGRMTPRDANWVSQEKGGSGRWEGLKDVNGASGGAVPSTLEDEEWTMNVLRPELINQWIRSVVSKFVEQKRKEHMEKMRKKAQEESEKSGNEKKKAEDENGKDDKDKVESKDEETDAVEAKTEQNDAKAEDGKDAKFEVSEAEQKAVTDSLRLNVNVFLPDVRVVDADQMKMDEEKVKEASVYLWDDVLPRVTRAVRDKNVSSLPYDGRALTEFLHRNGVNCRYLGRLATLAREEEERDIKTADDIKNGRLAVLSRRTMPVSWLELLECEIVARAAKHVLDAYLMENGSSAAAQPAQLVASFLSALVSEREETAAQTETRLEKGGPSDPDEDDMQALAIFDVGGDGDANPAPARSRYDIWHDIEQEVGRRFRYNLVLYNKGNKNGRALHVPLLRRVCQRTGIRLVAKDYEVGGRCYTEGNTSRGRLTASYPISPVDVIDVVPMMKHTASYFEGFSPCSLTPLMTPPLQISLFDARVALERAHLQINGRGLFRAMELAQEAANLYQRVTENGAHPGIVECVELMANVFHEANDPALAIENCSKALGLAVQSSGFDGPNVLNLHVTMFQMLYAAREFDLCVKHLRAAMYLLEISCGPRHLDHYDALHKLGAVYSHDEYNGKYSDTCVKIFKELEHLDPNDRLLEGFTLRSLAKALAESGEYKAAVDAEQKANKSLARFLTKEHAAMKESYSDLQKYTEQAVKEGNRSVEKKAKQAEEEKAQAIAATLVAEEDSKKKKNKKKKGKK